MEWHQSTCVFRYSTCCSELRARPLHPNARILECALPLPAEFCGCATGICGSTGLVAHRGSLAWGGSQASLCGSIVDATAGFCLRVTIVAGPCLALPGGYHHHA